MTEVSQQDTEKTFIKMLLYMAEWFEPSVNTLIFGSHIRLTKVISLCSLILGSLLGSRVTFEPIQCWNFIPSGTVLQV